MDKGYSPSEWIPKIKRGEDSRRLMWVCKECGFMGRSRTRHCGGCGRKMEKHDNLLNSYNHSTCGDADYQTDPERNKPASAESGN